MNPLETSLQAHKQQGVSAIKNETRTDTVSDCVGPLSSYYRLNQQFHGSTHLADSPRKNHKRPVPFPAPQGKSY